MDHMLLQHLDRVVSDAKVRGVISLPYTSEYDFAEIENWLKDNSLRTTVLNYDTKRHIINIGVLDIKVMKEAIKAEREKASPALEFSSGITFITPTVVDRDILENLDKTIFKAIDEGDDTTLKTQLPALLQMWVDYTGKGAIGKEQVTRLVHHYPWFSARKHGGEHDMTDWIRQKVNEAERKITSLRSGNRFL